MNSKNITVCLAFRYFSQNILDGSVDIVTEIFTDTELYEFRCFLEKNIKNVYDFKLIFHKMKNILKYYKCFFHKLSELTFERCNYFYFPKDCNSKLESIEILYGKLLKGNYKDINKKICYNFFHSDIAKNRNFKYVLNTANKILIYNCKITDIKRWKKCAKNNLKILHIKFNDEKRNKIRRINFIVSKKLKYFNLASTHIRRI